MHPPINAREKVSSHENEHKMSTDDLESDSKFHLLSSFRVSKENGTFQDDWTESSMHKQLNPPFLLKGGRFAMLSRV